MEEEKDIVTEIAKNNLRRAFKHYGIEGTEDKIKELYNNNVDTTIFLLNIYKEMIRNK